MATLLAPPGAKVAAHAHPEKRGSWELNGEAGWHAGPSMQHCRCVQCYFPRTREMRNCDTVEFFPHDMPFPKVSFKDHLHQAAIDLVSMLTHPPSSAVTSLQDGDSTRNALLQMAQILKRVDSLPETVDCHVPPRAQEESISKNDTSKTHSE